MCKHLLKLVEVHKDIYVFRCRKCSSIEFYNKRHVRDLILNRFPRAVGF